MRQRADVRRLAIAAAFAVAVDAAALALLSALLAEATRTHSLEGGPLLVFIEPGTGVTEPERALPVGTELGTSPKAAAQIALPTVAPVAAEPDAMPAADATGQVMGTELPRLVTAGVAAGGTELSVTGAGPGPDTELMADTALGTELSTREDLLIRLDEEIARNLSYPPRARERGIQGRVLLDLRVDEIGRLAGCSVETSSGSALLDGAARRLVTAIFPLDARLAAPFSALVAVEYKLR